MEVLAADRPGGGKSRRLCRRFQVLSLACRVGKTHFGQSGESYVSHTAVLSVDEEIDRFEDQLRAYVSRQHDAPAGLATLRELAAETRDRILDLDDAEIELELNDALRLEMRGYILNAVRALVRVRDAATDEQARRFAAEALVDLEATRHILRDAVDHEPLHTAEKSGEAMLSRADAARHMSEWLPALSRDQQADLLGVEPRSLVRWRKDREKPASWRAEMAVELVGVLRHSWTNEGVYRWFLRPHPFLDGRRPIDVLSMTEKALQDSDTDWEGRLVDAARGGRAQVAS